MLKTFNMCDQKKTLDVLISEYNQTVAVRTWKLSGRDRSALKNLSRCPEIVLSMLAAHFQKHRVSDACLQVDILQSGLFVPGTGRAPTGTCPLWDAILMVDDTVCQSFFERAINDFDRKVGSGNRQTKKACQLTEQMATELVEVCCLWVHIREPATARLGHERVTKLAELFSKGSASQCFFLTRGTRQACA